MIPYTFTEAGELRVLLAYSRRQLHKERNGLTLLGIPPPLPTSPAAKEGSAGVRCLQQKVGCTYPDLQSWEPSNFPSSFWHLLQ